MESVKYLGFDVHQGTISVAVVNADGKLVMQSVIATHAATILDFIHGLRGISRRVSYENLQGVHWEYSLAETMQHVVNHSSYHRGQVVVLLRQLGQTPPATDFLVFFDEQRSWTPGLAREQRPYQAIYGNRRSDCQPLVFAGAGCRYTLAHNFGLRSTSLSSGQAASHSRGDKRPRLDRLSPRATSSPKDQFQLQHSFCRSRRPSFVICCICGKSVSRSGLRWQRVLFPRRRPPSAA
jgi:DinB family protein